MILLVRMLHVYGSYDLALLQYCIHRYLQTDDPCEGHLREGGNMWRHSISHYPCIGQTTWADLDIVSRESCASFNRLAPSRDDWGHASTRSERSTVL
jgi:hypothetical protein